MSSSLFVPTVIETTGRGERAYDIFSRLLRERIVMVNGQIEETMANLVVARRPDRCAEPAKCAHPVKEPRVSDRKSPAFLPS